MRPKTTPAQRFRMTASAIASYTKHRCDRLFRWQIVPAALRGVKGIGWGVPKRERSASRPAVRLLMMAGDEFELEQVTDLWTAVGEDQFVLAGTEKDRGRTKVAEISLADFLAILRRPKPPLFIAQVELNLGYDPAAERSFLTRFGLDSYPIEVRPGRADLIQILPPEEDGAPYRLRIWDFKASQAARHDHFVQVAYYSLLLEQILAVAGLAHLQVDTETGVIRSRKGDEIFELQPYRRAVADFLQNRLPFLLDTGAADAHYHVCHACVTCEYADHCRAEADAGFDLSRIPYISSESKRKLKEQGLFSHRDLARLATSPDREQQLANLKALGQDLAVNGVRHLALAQALDDGEPRVLEKTTLLMPQHEDVRIVLSVEQDGVTGTCFALGIKTFEGFDEATRQVLGSEVVFVAEQPDDEASILLPFLRTINQLLTRVDQQNREIAARTIDGEPGYLAAQQAVDDAQQALDNFKARYPRITRTTPRADELKEERERLTAVRDQAKRDLRSVEGRLRWELIIKPQKKLHFYLYDTLDLLALRKLIERHLFNQEPPELLIELATLVRLFPPESVLQDADTFRTLPGTVVVNVLRALVALPIPYAYDLQKVSEVFQPSNKDGEEKGFVYRPRYGFGWEFSNQVAFERIHDVWKGKTIETPGKPGRSMTPEEIVEEIKRTVLSKLRATDTVIRRLKQDSKWAQETMGRPLLLLRKEPFRLHTTFDPLSAQMLEALRIFTVMEASLDELQVKSTHTLPVTERATRQESINGLRYIPGADTSDGALWFSFDPIARDTKFEPGDFTLVLTPEDRPMTLLGIIDGTLFQPSRRHDPYKVKLIAFDTESTPPRLCLQPDNPTRFRETFQNLDSVYVLDRLYIDFNSSKVLDVLQQLEGSPVQVQHLAGILERADVDGWQPFVADAERGGVESELYTMAVAAGVPREGLLNEGQLQAWRGIFARPISLVWGPPGTGKTYTVAHMLLGYMLAAKRLGRPLRVLVTAFTHHAIANVLNKLAELTAKYGVSASDLTIAKVVASSTHAADQDLAPLVQRIGDDGVRALVESAAPCVVVGGTVWSTYRTAKKQYGTPIQPLFDVVLVDEASQMKLPDALIAFAASKPTANLILAGDDQQLPPIIHGEYPEDRQSMLSSVFAFVRDRLVKRKEAGEADVEERTLFQLIENFRMNEPLTAYPRAVLYNGRYVATKRDIRIQPLTPIPAETNDLVDFLLHPERPVVLVRYTPARSFTARNPIEAELIVELTRRLSSLLIDQDKGQLYTAERFAAEGLGVLSPHRAQNSTIRQALRMVGYDCPERPLPIVDTVDKLQGQERDVIFVSYGVADTEYAEGEAEFLLSKNRFNVAATRARHKLIVLCSDTVLDVVPTDRKVLVDAMMLKEFRHYCDSGLRPMEWALSSGETITFQVQWKAFSQ